MVDTGIELCLMSTSHLTVQRLSCDGRRHGQSKLILVEGNASPMYRKVGKANMHRAIAIHVAKYENTKS
jgi:hypothetical protein